MDFFTLLKQRVKRFRIASAISGILCVVSVVIAINLLPNLALRLIVCPIVAGIVFFAAVIFVNRKFLNGILFDELRPDLHLAVLRQVSGSRQTVVDEVTDLTLLGDIVAAEALCKKMLADPKAKNQHYLYHTHLIGCYLSKKDTAAAAAQLALYDECMREDKRREKLEAKNLSIRAFRLMLEGREKEANELIATEIEKLPKKNRFQHLQYTFITALIALDEDRLDEAAGKLNFVISEAPFIVWSQQARIELARLNGQLPPEPQEVGLPPVTPVPISKEQIDRIARKKPSKLRVVLLVLSAVLLALLIALLSYLERPRDAFSAIEREEYIEEIVLREPINDEGDEICLYTDPEGYFCAAYLEKQGDGLYTYSSSIYWLSTDFPEWVYGENLRVKVEIFADESRLPEKSLAVREFTAYDGEEYGKWYLVIHEVEKLGFVDFFTFDEYEEIEDAEYLTPYASKEKYEEVYE